ncbi:MAG: hypothetical protein QOF00_3285 [Pseudonocardiales bacterium]|jgi:hypothetical protein|nr:hypothetical protein [Pseudonocardiales bacterium]
MPIRTRTSVLRKAPGTYETIEIELDDPRQNDGRSRSPRLACATPTTTSPPATSRSASCPTPVATKGPA